MLDLDREYSGIMGGEKDPVLVLLLLLDRENG